MTRKAKRTNESFQSNGVFSHLSGGRLSVVFESVVEGRKYILKEDDSK